MNKKFFSTAVAKAMLIIFSIFWINTSSATLIYSEVIDGDLDAIGSTNVNLVLGSNEILGVINQTPNAETDRIRFTQTAGLNIESIVLSFAQPFDDANIGQSMNSALFNSIANLFDDNFGTINSGVSISASFFDSFGPETGPLSKTTAGAIWDFQLSAGIVFPDQPWTLTITTTSDGTQPPTTSVPEPSTMAIFTLAMAGLLSRRLKQQS